MVGQILFLSQIIPMTNFLKSLVSILKITYNKKYLYIIFQPLFSYIKPLLKLRACTEEESSPHTSGLDSTAPGIPNNGTVSRDS